MMEMSVAPEGSTEKTPHNPIVSRDEWLDARMRLLSLEKEETHLRDKVRAERQAMPWVRVDKHYVFDTPNGKKTLADLFDGRSQLMIYHFMMGPDWDAGCVGCSFLADHVDGAIAHLNNHDVTFVAASRAPLDKIESYKTRMGWQFPWVSSFGTEFNFDFHVSFTPEDLAGDTIRYNYRDLPREEGHDELPGLSSFFKDEAGEVFHTYSSYARGGEEIIGTLMILDRAPLGRNESATMHFVKRHDEYEGKPQASKSSCH